jgi:putative transposase
MTYLPSHVTGQWFYLYLIMDLYSRKIVGRSTRSEAL